MNNELYFGTAYCPYAKSGDLDREFWERDIETMKNLNINIIRPFVVWDRIETEEGVYDFSALDHLFDLAEKHDMRILLNLGGVLNDYAGLYPPRWLIYDYKVQPIVVEPGLEKRQFGPGRRLCPDDPVYYEKAMEFLKNVILRYRERSCLSAWNLWNEPFYHGNGCFCPLTLAKFRLWLRNQYQTLDKLNEAWGSEFPVLYRDWDDVEPGTPGAEFCFSYVPRMDWYRFNRARVAGWLDNVRYLVRKYDGQARPVTVNVVASAPFWASYMHSWPSMFDQNREVDIPGYSAYTFYGQMRDAAWPNAAAFSWVRSSGKDPGKGFWAIETEAGQTSYFPKGHSRAERGWRIASNWQLVLHGAKMVMLWKFGGRVTDSQTTEFNLTAWDGSITERAQLQGDFAGTFLKNESLFKERIPKAEVAILVSSDSEIAAIADRTHKTFMNACHGAYHIMHDLRISCDFIDDVWVKRGRLSRYKALLVPAAAFLNAELASCLERFVADGGCVIADRFFGMKDEKTAQFQTTPGFGLQQVFGACMNDAAFSESDEKLTMEGLPDLCSIGDLFHSHLLLNGAHGVGGYSCGGSAVSRNRYGRGSAWLWGVEPFHLYGEEKNFFGWQEQQLCPEDVPARDAFVRQLMRQALCEAGVESDYSIQGDLRFSLETGALTGEDGSRIHFLINFADSPMKFSLEIRSGGHFKDLLSDFRYQDAPAEVELPAYGVMILCPAG